MFLVLFSLLVFRASTRSGCFEKEKEGGKRERKTGASCAGRKGAVEEEHGSFSPTGQGSMKHCAPQTTWVLGGLFHFHLTHFRTSNLSKQINWSVSFVQGRVVCVPPPMPPTMPPAI
eukprot:TRINITY_DN62857_c0_g2_i1.p1 TRINITY_DN62857_c0_g2~~TRINITY_DN62857_c0_g2_i1.p1  ORF type:complete len:117 (-),score=0.90 TRINITY_DN62857_c0_g2_i1:25-375(-)